MQSSGTKTLGRLALCAAICALAFASPAQTPGSSVPIPGMAPATPTPPPPGANLPYLTIKDIETIKSRVGQTILIRGEVDEFTASWNERAPNIIYLRDATNEIELVYWVGPMTPGPVPDMTKKGTPVFARGRAEVYRGRLQVNIADPVAGLSTRPLAADVVSGARDAATAASGSQRPQGTPSPIKWEPYSPLAAQSDFAQGKPVIVYARSRAVPLCETVEKAYMLHPELATIIGPRTIYYLELSQQADVLLAQQLQIVRVPTLVVLANEKDRKPFEFTKDTQTAEVVSFLKAIPRPSAP